MTLSSSPRKGRSFPAWAAFTKKATSHLGSPADIAGLTTGNQTQISRWLRGYARPASLAAALTFASQIEADLDDAATAYASDPPSVADKLSPRSASTDVAIRRGTGSLEALIAAKSAYQAAERALDEAVLAARAQGTTWADLGRMLTDLAG